MLETIQSVEHPLAGKIVEIIKSPLSVLPGAKTYNVVDVSGYMIQLRIAEVGDHSADEMILQIAGRAFWVGLQGLLIIECEPSKLPVKTHVETRAPRSARKPTRGRK